MKRVVIIRSNPVDPDSRVEKEANSLAKSGYEVTLVVWDRTENYKVRIDNKHLNDCLVKRVSFGAKAEYGAGLKSIVPFVKFQFRLFAWLVKNRNIYDIGHFCDFDTAFTGSATSFFTRKKIIFDIFDYLSTNPDSIFRKLIKKLEDGIINRADATIICTEQRKEQIKDAKPKRLVVIHNSPDEITLGENVIKSNSSRVKVVYVGILQEKERMLKELVETISAMSEVEFHVGGFGELEEYMIEVSRTFNNIFFYGKLPYKDTLALEKECDIITAIYNPIVGNSLYAAPNKFYEALMLGKPLIMVKNTGMSEIIEHESIGILIDCDKESFNQGLVTLINKRSEWSLMGKKMIELYNTQFSWKEMERRLLDLYKSL